MKPHKNTNKRKILIVLRSHPSKNLGGAPYQADIIAHELASDPALEVYYAANYFDDACRPSYKLVGIPSTNRLLERFTSLQDYSALRKIIENINPDVVYQNALTGHTGACARICKRLGIRFVYHIASDFDVMPDKYLAGRLSQRFFERLHKRYARLALQQADAVIAQTRKQAALLEKFYLRSAELVFPNILPFPEHSDGKSSDELHVVWIANLKPVKRPELFVELAERCLECSYLRFTMIGGMSAEYEELLHRAESLANFNYLGKQSIEEVNDLLHSAHVLVNTSVTEGYSNTFVQAWMREVLVLSLGADVDDMLASGRLGYMATGIDEVKQILLDLWAMPDKRKEIGHTAREYSRENNSIKSISSLKNVLLAS